MNKVRAAAAIAIFAIGGYLFLRSRQQGTEPLPSMTPGDPSNPFSLPPLVSAGDVFGNFNSDNASTPDTFSILSGDLTDPLQPAPDTGTLPDTLPGNPTSNASDPGSDMFSSDNPPATGSDPNSSVGSVPNPSGRSLGVQLNNPGNMRPGGPAYNGQIGIYTHPRAGQFLVFSETPYGMRAMAVLIRYWYRQGRRTPSQLISTWAPSSENNTGAYIASVAASGVDTNGDVMNQLLPLMRAMIKVEQGYAPYSDDEIQSGIAAA